ncbi:MAG: ComF family protein [bacterium]|nr:ComF family protein [bacterium]
MSFLHDLLNFIFPPHCSICKKYLKADEKIVCNECFNGIPVIVPPFCARCGKPTGGENVCNDCIKNPHQFTRLIALSEYSDIARDFVLLFKNKQKLSLGKRLASLMAVLIKQDEFIFSADVIIPVPIHRVVRRHRGFNQSEILAIEISKITGIPMISDTLIQIKRTRPQKSFSSKDLDKEIRKEKRMLNVKDAFTVKNSEAVKNKRIIVIDDVCTTGATLDECSRELYKAGAEDVYAVVIAKV